MDQVTQATTPAAPIATALRPDRGSYRRAQALAHRLVEQVPTLPSAAEVHRSLAFESFEARLHFGTGLTAGRGVLETAALTDTEVTREEKRDDRGNLVGCWIGLRTVVDGVPLSAWALTSEADADQLLQSTCPEETGEEAATEVTQPLPTVGTAPSDVVVPAVAAVTSLAAKAAEREDGK
jgi:hypothetical protein